MNKNNNAVSILLLIWIICISVLATRTSLAGDSEDIAGKELYIARGCYQCHGYEGQGAKFTGPKIAPGLLPLPQFRQILRHPYGTMPAYSPKVLDDDGIQSIYSFLLTIPVAPNESILLLD